MILIERSFLIILVVVGGREVQGNAREAIMAQWSEREGSALEIKEITLEEERVRKRSRV